MAAFSTSLDADSSVELRTVADVEDAATSARFFREDDGAGGAISSSSWPRAEKTRSKLTSQKQLQHLCDKNDVPAGYTPSLVGVGWRACQPPLDGSICIYADALVAGLRIPLHDFYVAVLLHYGLAPSQLSPNSWSYMAAFVLLCKDVGVDPMLSVFRCFFSLSRQSEWYHFRLAGLHRLCTGRMPRWDDWQARFLLLQSPSTAPWPCAVKWGKPCRDAVCLPPKATRDTVTAIKKLLDGAGTSGLDVMSFLSRHRHSLPVGTLATLTPEQRAMKVEEGAAAGPRSEPTPTTRKRKSLEILTQGPDAPAACGLQSQAQQFGSSTLSNDCSTMHGFFLSIQGAASEFGKKMAVELEKKEKELQESKMEVTQLRSMLAKLKQEHDDKVAQLTEQHTAQVAKLNQENAGNIMEVTQLRTMLAKLKQEHDDKVTQLTEQHTAQAKLNQENACNIACLKPVVEKEADAMKDRFLACLKFVAEKEVDAVKGRFLALIKELQASQAQPGGSSI